MVVGWGRWGRAIAQTPVLRAGVPWSSTAGLRGSTRKALRRPHQIHHSSAGAPIFTPFASGIVKGTASATSGPPSIRTTNLARS